MGDLVTALALVLVIEGIALALFADRLERLLTALQAVPPEVLRISGLLAAGLGLFVVWLLRG